MSDHNNFSDSQPGAVAIKRAPLKQRLKPLVPFRFPNFEEHYRTGTTNKAFYFDTVDCRVWYAGFVDRLVSAMERRQYLPVYRMGDGEYTFALGGASGKEWEPPVKSWRAYARKMLSLVIHGRGYHRSGSGEYGCEEYDRHDRAGAYGVFVDCLRKIAKDGIIAPALHVGPFYGKYIPAILDWYDANKIELHEGNFQHVYAVYVMMHGPDRERLIRNRRVLVVTSLTEEKKNGIERGLRAIGASDIQYLPISRNKALLETIDLARIEKPVDIALVGAGIGSVSILVQLAPLSIPCIDVGFVLSTLGNPDIRWNRPFCVPDGEFDIDRIRYLSPEELAQAKALKTNPHVS